MDRSPALVDRPLDARLRRQVDTYVADVSAVDRGDVHDDDIAAESDDHVDRSAPDPRCATDDERSPPAEPERGTNGPRSVVGGRVR